MTLSAEQRDKVVHYLGGACLLREAADMLGVPWVVFAQDYRLGMADAEAGRDTEAGRWYLAVRAERSRTRATIRAEAHAVAGSRESTDLLALLTKLEAEPEPLPSTAENPRATGSLWLVDALENPNLDEVQRGRLTQVSQAYHDAAMAVLEVQLSHDAERRGQGVAA